MSAGFDIESWYDGLKLSLALFWLDTWPDIDFNCKAALIVFNTSFDQIQNKVTIL